MNILVLTHVVKQFIPALLLVFVLVGFLGAGYGGMAIDAKGEMSLCPLMGVSTFCRMNPLEHLAVWQRMFVVFPQKDMRALLLFMLFSISAVFALRNFSRGAAVSASCLAALRRVGAPPIGRALQEPLSQGILNPKIF